MLLTKLHTYPTMRRLVKEWLKAGVLEGYEFTATTSGTPQGGVISPLLANIALHGLETTVNQVGQDGKRRSSSAMPMILSFSTLTGRCWRKQRGK